MINNMRYLIQKGDPRLQVQVPIELLTLLAQTAKEHKRRLADEFIYLMGFSLKNEAQFDWAEAKLELMAENAAPVGKHIQVMPREMLELLKIAALHKQNTLDEEISLRLAITLKHAQEIGVPHLSLQILGKKFTHAEVSAQQIADRNAHLYLYEYEKLKLFIRFEKSLPRRIKESFTLIDVKEATKQIKKELEKESEET